MKGIKRAAAQSKPGNVANYTPKVRPSRLSKTLELGIVIQPSHDGTFTLLLCARRAKATLTADDYTLRPHAHVPRESSARNVHPEYLATVSVSNMLCAK